MREWVVEVAEAPSRIGDRKLRDRHMAVNHEHPALMKTLGDPHNPQPAFAPPFLVTNPFRNDLALAVGASQQRVGGQRGSACSPSRSGSTRACARSP